MIPDQIIDRLVEHRTLGGAPRQELAWLASHGSLQHMNAGDVLTAKGTPVAGMFIVLSGRIAIFVDRGAGLQKSLEWRGGDVTGLLPYSRLTTPPGDTVAQEPTDILKIDRECLRDMILACHEVTSLLVHAMLDRARAFTSSDLLDEKLMSLGKLSAGLAHELNNPVSAIERSATLLEERLDEAQRTSRAIGAAHLTDAQLAAIDGLQAACLKPAVHGVRSRIEQAEWEEAIADWLTDHAVDPAIDQIAATPNIRLRPETELDAVEGNGHVESVALRSMREGAVRAEPVDAVFIFIGTRPQSGWLPAAVLRDDKGFVLTGRDVSAVEKYRQTWKESREPLPLETSVPGVFAAGDLRAGAMNRVASAVGEGSMVVRLAHEYLALTRACE
jgi:CRP-like cAMP-binding protein